MDEDEFNKALIARAAEKERIGFLSIRFDSIFFGGLEPLRAISGPPLAGGLISSDSCAHGATLSGGGPLQLEASLLLG